MKKINYILAAFAALAALSCAKELRPDTEGKAVKENEPKPEVVWTLNAGFPQEGVDQVAPASRTALNGTKVNWTAGDQIVVNGVTSLALESENIFNEGASATFEFSSIPEGDTLVVLYPAAAYGGTTEKNGATYYTFDVPDTQSYDYNTQSVDSASTILVGKTTNGSAALEHAMAYLKITVTDADIKSIRVMANAYYNSLNIAKSGMSMSGLRRISTEADYPSDVLVPDNGSTVTLDFGDSGLPSGTPFVMPVVPRNYNQGLNFFVVTTDGKYKIFRSESGVNLSTKHGKLLDMSLTLGDNLKDYHGLGIYSRDDYESFVRAYEAEDYAKWMGEDGEFNLYADIACQYGFTRIGANDADAPNGLNVQFAHVFDGNGYSMRQDSSVVALFSGIAESGIVKNLVLDGKGYHATTRGWGTSQLTIRNYGTIQGCTSNMTIDVIDTEPNTNAIYAGPFVCTNSGTMRSCINNGDITISLLCTANRVVMAGGLAAINSYASDSEHRCGNFLSCKNYGDITITKTSTDNAKHILGRCGVGGICGRVEYGEYGGNYSIFDYCENYGNITFHEDSYSSNIPMMFGGLIGSAAPYITSGGSIYCVDFSQTDGYYLVVRTSCKNYGTLDISSSNTSATSASVSGARQVYVGGLIGFIYGQGSVTQTNGYAVLRGYNYGTIKLGSKVGNECAGGLAGGSAFTKIDAAGGDFKFEKTSNDRFTPAKVGNCAAVVGMVVKRTDILGNTNQSTPMTFKMDASALSGYTVLNTGLAGVTSAKSVDGTGTSVSHAVYINGARYTLFQGRKPDGSNFNIGTFTAIDDCDALFGGTTTNRKFANGATLVVEAYPES